MRLSRNLAWSLLCILVSVASADTRQTAGAHRTLAGCSRPFWEGLWVGFSRHTGVGVFATRAEGGRKVDGRWTEGGQRTPVSVSSSKRPPRCVRRPSSGFSAGSQRVSRRCSEGAPFVGSPANASPWTRFRPAPAERLTLRCRYAAESDSGRARGVSPIPEFGRLP
jgi:hypothetical protein